MAKAVSVVIEKNHIGGHVDIRTPPEALDKGEHGSSKMGGRLRVVLAATLWVTLSICLIPVLGIGVFMLPLTAQHSSRASRLHSVQDPDSWN